MWPLALEHQSWGPPPSGGSSLGLRRAAPQASFCVPCPPLPALSVHLPPKPPSVSSPFLELLSSFSYLKLPADVSFCSHSVWVGFGPSSEVVGEAGDGSEEPAHEEPAHGTGFPLPTSTGARRSRWLTENSADTALVVPTLPLCGHRHRFCLDL